MGSTSSFFPTLVLGLVLSFSLAFHNSPLSPYMVNSFPSAPNVTLNHFTVSTNGSVYVGAVNNLYHLSQSFDVVNHVEFQNGERNVNKILAIIPSPVDELISCGTGLNGTCQRRNLDEISQDVIYLSPLSLTIASEKDSAVGLVVEDVSERISLHVAQTVKIEDRFFRRPIMSICLNKRYPNGCRLEDNRETTVLSGGVPDDFIIQYVYAFSYQGYTYYVSSQRRDATNPNSPIVPKMSRFCHNDATENLSGFTEITLECKGNDGAMYNIAKSAAEVNDTLYIALVKNIPEHGRNINEANQSALCMYKLDILRKEFEDSIVNCSCAAEIASSNTYLSNSVCNSVHFGTEPGHTGVLFEKLEMGCYPLLEDTWINPVGDTAMFLTEKQLLEIVLANCSQYDTCEQCIKPASDEGDPYCGWCTLENRCTRYERCKGSNIQSRWLGFNETKCSAITDVTPDILSIDAHSQMVEITVCHLPDPGEFNYMCHFGPFFTSEATLNDGLLSCLSPGITEVPRIPYGEEAVEVMLTISSTELNIHFVTFSYNFFNCNRIKGCIDCVSKWPCDWCIDEFRCMYSQESGCSNITGPRDDAIDVCPLLAPGEVLIPSGVESEVQVTVRNLNLTASLPQREFECLIEGETVSGELESTVTVIAASSGYYNVTCSNILYSYSLEMQEIAAILTLRWKNTGVFLDGIYNVTMFKCHIDRPDCSRCLSNITTRPEYECGWCNVLQGFCAVEESCSSNILRECSTPPQITWVSPTSSPIEGGTIVEIRGTDLGQRFSDIINVNLAGVVCHHRNHFDKYQVGASLTCETGNSIRSRQGNVVVFLVNGIDVEYDQFSYNDPQISSFYPMVGPQSGGTLISIDGTDLQTGRDILVAIGNDNCFILQHSSTNIVCENEGLAWNESVPQNQTVSVTFDGHMRLATEQFAYHQDPVVTEIMPLRTITSGGILLTVTGERFLLIQKPKIRFTVDGRSAEEECSSLNRNEMEIICKSPNVSALLEQRRRRAESAAEGMVAVGFIMDGVTSLLDWSQKNGVVFQYFKDPEYETFDVRDHEKTTNNLLKLSGNDLDLASTIQDVTVYIGTQLCTVISLEANALICDLPTEQPDKGDLYGNRMSRGLPFVLVKHANLEFGIGYLSYTDGVTDILRVVIPVFCVIVIVVITIVLVSIWYNWRKDMQTARDLELEVRNMEESVNENLHALFASLKTTMHDFELALQEQTRIPLLNKRQYLLNMLFHGLRVIPLASSSEEILRNSNMKTAMEEFSALLYHKSFLKVFLSTLEKTTRIRDKEKTNVGSLLCVCLLHEGKLELYTDALFSLVQKQIKTCEYKENRRLLFSRNDNLVGKLLSNWASIFLYGFLKQQTASEVYQLYEAIKYVCEKGPIDAVSGKSQFSINELDMLEKQIDFKEVKLDFVTKSGKHKSLTVLDVSTITQVKDAIISHHYSYMPYSQRPSPFALDLVCRTGGSGHVVFRDDGNLSGSLENGWKKINTLADYKISKDSTFELLPKEEHDSYARISGFTGRRDESTGDKIHHFLYKGGEDYEATSLEHSNVANEGDILQLKMKSDDIGEGASSASSDSTLNKVTGQENLAAAIPSDEPSTQANSTDYSHNLYRLSGPHYEDIPDETLEVATNADMIRFKGKGYDVNITEGVKLWHLIKENAQDRGDYEDVPEPLSHEETEKVVLSFLPPTMNNIQKFLDKLINAMFAADGQTEVPSSIKCLFQFFDREAEKEGNVELATAWKNNVLPLGYWSTIIANPYHVLDVGEYAYIQASLKIIVQVIKDTCDGHIKRHRNQGNSPSRLLYSHFLKGYKSKLDNYYQFVANLGRVDSEDLRQECRKVEQEFRGTFDVLDTQQKLFSFVADFQNELTEALENDNVCKQLSHATKLRRVADKIK